MNIAKFLRTPFFIEHLCVYKISVYEQKKTAWKVVFLEILQNYQNSYSTEHLWIVVFKFECIPILGIQRRTWTL